MSHLSTSLLVLGFYHNDKRWLLAKKYRAPMLLTHILLREWHNNVVDDVCYFPVSGQFGL